jgi:hypothetical protein
MFLWLLLVAPVLLSAQPEIFSCRESWSVTKEGHERRSNELQAFLLAFQSDCSICAAGTVSAVHNAGIGSSLGQGVLQFAIALQERKAYRPGYWIWAASEASCTLNLHSLDCFFQPLTYCHVGGQQPAVLDIGFKATDVCSLAATFQKPLIWIFGQILHFITRPRPDLSFFIAKRKYDAFKMYGEGLVEGTVGVHIRAGRPDGGRHVLPLEKYMQAVDTKAADLAAVGIPVHTVYIASDDLNTTVRSQQYLEATYPRTWKYIILPHTTLGSGEQEMMLRSGDWNDTIRTNIVSEFMADIAILAQAHVFIGSHSNIYAVVGALRLARYPMHPLQYTCFFDSHEPQVKLSCEGSDTSMQFWSKSFGFQTVQRNNSFWVAQ